MHSKTLECVHLRLPNTIKVIDMNSVIKSVWGALDVLVCTVGNKGQVSWCIQRTLYSLA